MAVEKEGFPLLVFIRAMYAPIAFKNYGLAVLNVSIIQVLVAGFLTSIPHSFAFAYLGTKIGSLTELQKDDDNDKKLSVWKLLLGENYEELWLLLLFGVPIVVVCGVVFRNFYLRFNALLKEDDNDK